VSGEPVIIAIVAAVYLAGVYVTALIAGYRDAEPAAGIIVFWPFVVGAVAIVAAVMPFVLLGIWLFNAGQALRGDR
jgi:hypothetical protein